MSIFKFGLPQLLFKVSQTKTKTEFRPKGFSKINGIYVIDANMSKKPCAKLYLKKRSRH